MEVSVMEEEVWYIHTSPETGDTACHSVGPHGEAPGSIRGRRREGKHAEEPLLCFFCGMEWVNQSKQA